MASNNKLKWSVRSSKFSYNLLAYLALASRLYVKQASSGDALEATPSLGQLYKMFVPISDLPIRAYLYIYTPFLILRMLVEVGSSRGRAAAAACFAYM